MSFISILGVVLAPIYLVIGIIKAIKGQPNWLQWHILAGVTLIIAMIGGF